MTSIIYEIVLCSFLTFVSTDLRTVIYKYTHIGHRNTAGFIRSVLSGLAESSLSYFVGQKYSQLLPFCIHTYRVPDKWFSLRIPACNEAEVLNRSWWVAPSLAFWALTSFQIRYGYRYYKRRNICIAQACFTECLNKQNWRCTTTYSCLLYYTQLSVYWVLR